MRAEVRRTLRGDRKYDPTKDPFKIMIRERQAHYLAKRLRAGPVTPAPTEVHEVREVEPDYLRPTRGAPRPSPSRDDGAKRRLIFSGLWDLPPDPAPRRSRLFGLRSGPAVFLLDHRCGLSAGAA